MRGVLVDIEALAMPSDPTPDVSVESTLRQVAPGWIELVDEAAARGVGIVLTVSDTAAARQNELIVMGARYAAQQGVMVLMKQATSENTNGR